MNIENIKVNIAYRVLNRRLKRTGREVTVSNFEKSRTIGVVFNAINENIFEIVKAFVLSLSNNNKIVNTIGYINSSVSSGKSLHVSHIAPETDSSIKGKVDHNLFFIGID